MVTWKEIKHFLEFPSGMFYRYVLTENKPSQKPHGILGIYQFVLLNLQNSQNRQNLFRV